MHACTGLLGFCTLIGEGQTMQSAPFYHWNQCALIKLETHLIIALFLRLESKLKIEKLGWCMDVPSNFSMIAPPLYNHCCALTALLSVPGVEIRGTMRLPKQVCP